MFEGVLWDPILFLWLLTFLALLVYIFGKFWNLSYNKGVQREPFFSGNEETDETHPRASDIYWGFMVALSSYYKDMKKIHTNNVNDYVYWFVIVLALVLVFVGVS